MVEVKKMLNRGLHILLFRDYKGEMVNRFGERFSITTFGESHGKAIGCIIDGVPAGLKSI